MPRLEGVNFSLVEASLIYSTDQPWASQLFLYFLTKRANRLRDWGEKVGSANSGSPFSYGRANLLSSRANFSPYENFDSPGTPPTR